MPVVAFSAFCSAVAILGSVHRLIRSKRMLPLAVAYMVWAGIFTVSVLVVLKILQLPGTYRSFLSLWRLEGRAVPLWVGEFGTKPGDTSIEWRAVLGLAQSLKLAPYIHSNKAWSRMA